MSWAASKTALILNPATTDDASSIVELVRNGCRDHGWNEMTVEQTTTSDPGSSQARRAVFDGADLVIACGGDGTVAAVADGLAHSGVPMGILSSGTGNLLCRNLGIPTEVHRALDVALGEHKRVIDLGRIDENCFVVMAGMGFDASVMQETSDKMKTRIGWLAYVLAGARNLVHRPMLATIRLDEERYVQGAARTVLIGNVGRLQGGVSVLPDADPSDGLLDVVIIAPRGSGDWLAVAWQIIRRRCRTDARLRRFRASRIEIETDHPVPRQFDGEVLAPARWLHVEVDPAALVVKVPS
jgi:YegS/Rv2252/BmrU family lipid kinase